MGTRQLPCLSLEAAKIAAAAAEEKAKEMSIGKSIYSSNTTDCSTDKD